MPDNDVIDGKIKQGEGRLQDAFGALTGDADAQIEGKAKQAEGALQEGVGHVKDGVRDANNTADADADTVAATR